MLQEITHSEFARLLEHFMNSLATKSYVFGSHFQSGRVKKNKKKKTPGPCSVCLMQTPKFSTETGPGPLYSNKECVFPI